MISLASGAFWFLVNSMAGRLILGGLTLYGAWKINNYYQQKKGAAMAVERSIKHGEEINRENAKVRREARKPGAAERLLRDYCRDC